MCHRFGEFARLTGAHALAAALVVIMAVGVMGFEDNFRDMVEASTDLNERDYGVLASQIQAVIPAGSRVVGPPVFWIGLSQSPYDRDYVDFFGNEHHAANAGRIFRPDGEPLTPNWKHLPIGYHGRSGTIVPSGTPVNRPCGQRPPAGRTRAVRCWPSAIRASW